MKTEHKKILIIAIVVGVAVIALVLGLVLGLKKKDKSDEDEEEGVLNSYDNTEVLIKKYPVLNPTTVLEGIEKKIQNRLLTGFENWNRGFDIWKAWGNILYTKESIYNVHGARLSLESYQAAMDISLKQQTILMGDFHNMLITGEFAAIHYDFLSGKTETKKEDLKKSRVMEFVKFKDYGEELGTRVEEGWGSTKDASAEGLKQAFQADKEKAEQEEQDNYILNYVIPSVDNLEDKYIIKYHTEYRDKNANLILNIILEGFDKWNAGKESYLTWVDSAYDTNAKSSSLDERDRTMDVYKKEIEELFSKEKIEKLYFDNILIRENWAGLHYRYRRENLKNHEISIGDRMQFLKFEEKEGTLKITGSWIQ